jgi:tetratricopeptide (TPR) repeat protein
MTGSRVVASCCFAFLILPLVSAAQSNLTNGDPAAKAGFAATVSARQLRIPEKARRAFNKGTQRLAARDWAGSIPEFQKAIKAFGDLYEAYYKIGIAQLELQQRGEAETSFRKSIELSAGRYAPPLLGLGLALGSREQFDEAEAFARAGLGLEPTDAAAYFTMAWVLFHAGRVPEAEKSAREGLLYNPNMATAHLLLAQIHHRQNNKAALVADLDTYLRLEPNGPQSDTVRAIYQEARQMLAMENAASVSAKSNP